MVHLKRCLLLLAALLAIHLLQPVDLSAAARKAKPKPKPKAKTAITAQSVLVMNMTTGEILYAKNPDTPIAPASLTKILSLYLIYEALEEGRVRTSDIVAIGSGVSQVNGSRMRIRPGTQIALGDLMKGMAVLSANDASVAAAEYVAGDVGEFVRRMNVKALELGMSASHFENPSGLREDGQVTTARDILRLSCAYISRFPQSLQLHSIPSFQYGRKTGVNTNHLLEKTPCVDGLKTGHVAGAGYHLVLTARRDGTRVVVVVLGSRSSGARFREARMLLEDAFRKIQPHPAVRRVAGAPAIEAPAEKTTGGFGDS
ncbi:MAG: D-alanyl-D-alanine carboxypeptidase [Syntrophaceae bacterium]|nr:D-alanyl-D-alanine carboxypeptidase [Syntrophaceae bacterium]